MQQDEMKKIIDHYIKAYKSFDIDGMLLHMHEEISFQNISNGQISLSTKGVSELRKAAEQASNIFKSRCQTVTDYQFDGDIATTEIDYVGEIATDIPDGPKAGDIIKLMGKSEFIFKDGSIIKLADIS
jgi:hypothetical protein